MIANYLTQIVLYTVLTLALYLPVRLAVVKAKRLRSTAFHEIALALFVCCVVAIVSQTLLPELQLENYRGWSVVLRFQSGSTLTLSTAGAQWARVPYIVRRCNLVPFRTIALYFRAPAPQSYAAADAPLMFVVNVLGNVFFVLPFGFLLPLAVPQMQRAWKVFAAGSVLIIAIELAQFFIGRAADVDDYILNLLGIMGGYALLHLPGIRRLKEYARTKATSKSDVS